MRTDLIATVSHELRTPLAAVYGAAMTLQRTPQLDGRMHEQLVTIIGKQAERLARIVDDVLTASRAAETDAPPPEEFDAVAVAEAVVHDAAARTGRRDLTRRGRPATRDREPGRAAPRARQPRRQRDQVRARAGRSPCTWGTAARRCSIAVADEGPGNSPRRAGADLRALLPARPAMASGVGGTGLGLYIARRLVEQMGGRLSVSLGAGARDDVHDRASARVAAFSCSKTPAILRKRPLTRSGAVT